MEAGPCLESHHKDYKRMYWRMSVAMAIVAAVQVLNAHKVVNTPASFVASLIRQNIRRNNDAFMSQCVRSSLVTYLAPS